MPGEMAILCIEGEVAQCTPLRTIALSAGPLVVLNGGEPQAVDSLSDSTLLVTVLLKA
jgi:quercetin dioxygenase-like cupin family protein